MTPDLLSGIIAAFTPCTVVLIPLMLYRFGIWGPPGTKIKIKELLLFLVGFFVSFLAAGLVLQRLLGSDFINITRLVLGSVLIIAGIWQFLGEYSIAIYTTAANPLLLGLLMPLVISISPCVLPLVSTILVNGNDGSSVLHLTLFAAGILAPALIAAIVGNQVWGGLKRVTRYTRVIESVGGLILFGSGAFLVFDLFVISLTDVVLAGTGLLILIVFCSYTVIGRNSTSQNILWLLGIISVFGFGAWYLLGSQMGGERLLGAELILACTNGQPCPGCLAASISFCTVAVLLGLWLVVGQRPGRRLRFGV